MDITKKEEMTFREAWYKMLAGYKVKRPLWQGFWAWEDGSIKMHCRDGKVLDIRETDCPAYTFTNIAQRDWMVVE